MAAPLNPSLLVPIGVSALVLWRFYSRVRRMIGRQHLSNVRPWITVSIFPLILVLFAATAISQPASLLALGGGTVIGVCLGIYGLRVTKFENTPQGLFYTPSAHLGIALSLLLVGRILYRLVLVYSSTAVPAGPPVNYATTPLTLLIFGTLAGYYVTYAIGLLRWHRECTRAGGAGRVGGTAGPGEAGP
jgi:hypothetical protein